MAANTDRQTQIVEAVEVQLRDTTASFMEGPLLDAMLQIWRDFADETDVSRTQKPETWAAALLYVIDQMQLGNDVSQGDAAEYEALLRLNPDDNQGARFELGPLYQLAGDLDAALDAYDHYAENYPDDWGGPHHRFCWGLALFHDDQPKAALRRWREAIFQNVYVAPLLLDEPFPPTDVWHRINTGEPFYAERYLDRYGALWSDDALAALDALWQADPVQDALDEWLELGRRLNDLAEAARSGDEDAQRQWRRLMRKQQSIEDASFSNTELRRLLKQMP